MSTTKTENESCEHISKMYLFSVERNTFTVLAKCKEEAIDILSSTLAKLPMIFENNINKKQHFFKNILNII